MKFETKAVPDSPDHVAQFFEDLEDHPNEEEATAYKILLKLDDWDVLTYEQMMAAEKLKKVEGDAFEVRVKVKGDCYRFLGYIEKDTVFMVHAIKKKTNKLSRKDIELAKNRIQVIKKYENRRT